MTKQYPCTCELRAFGDRHNATIDALLKCGMSYTEIMDKLGLVRFPNAIAMDHKCPRCQEAGMYDEEASNWTPEPWQAGREDAQSYYGDTGQPFSSVYRQDDDDRMPLTPDGFGGMTRVPLRIAYVEGKDIPRDEEKANARRIVACVNACTGLADPAAEIKAMREKIDRLEAVVRRADKMRATLIGGAGGLARIQAAHQYDGPRSRVTLPPSPTDFPAQEKAGKQEIVDDGFGTSADKCEPDCTLQVVRPGDIRCDGSGAKCPNKEASNAQA